MMTKKMKRKKIANESLMKLFRAHLWSIQQVAVMNCYQMRKKKKKEEEAVVAELAKIKEED